MREIKFRAWVNDGNYSRMVKSDQAVFTALRNGYNKTGVGEGTTGYHYVDNVPKPNKYILMQYTGLKDKNGVEIYEGDCFKGKSGIKIVKYKDGAFVTEYKFNIRGFKEVNISPLIVTSRESVVIGNIYENPELLEVQNG